MKSKVFKIICTFTLCFNSVFGGTDELTGEWWATQASKGGISTMRHYKTEGRVEIKPGIFIWGNYTYDDASSLSIIYENLVAPLYDFTISISENTLEMKLEGEPGVILSRETPGEGLIGKWKGKPDNGPPVDVIYEFTDTNKVYVSVQFQKAKQGKYTFIDKTVSESFSKGNTFSFQLVEQEGMYFLKNTENGEIVYQKRTY